MSINYYVLVKIIRNYFTTFDVKILLSKSLSVLILSNTNYYLLLLNCICKLGFKVIFGSYLATHKIFLNIPGKTRSFANIKCMREWPLQTVNIKILPVHRRTSYWLSSSSSVRAIQSSRTRLAGYVTHKTRICYIQYTKCQSNSFKGKKSLSFILVRKDNTIKNMTGR